MISFLGRVLFGLFLIAVGFAIGRIKNRAKLAAIQAHLNKVDADAKADAPVVASDTKTAVAKLVAEIRKLV